ncbi:MAG: gliding motility-associated C-terminal domain-containing protein [Flavobacteriales bacterium]|nr:gliding motility-associated C-terminal domain-containing protein [Flavobacteriales bacterium]
MKHILFLIFTLGLTSSVLAQNEIWMRPNMGQWHDNVEYRISIPGGFMYLEKGGFTYQLSNFGHHYDHGHGHDHDHSAEESEEYKEHVVKTQFVGANPSPLLEHSEESPFYENYLIGNDPSKWVSNLRLYEEVEYFNLYDDIDLHLYQTNGTLKYDVIVHPGADPSTFVVEYEGHDNIKLKGGILYIQTSLGSIIEGKPQAFQTIGGIKQKVNCQYKLVGNQMHFVFPEGYDESVDLIIDPELSFSTFTGSTADNWGMTACPDVDQKLIAAGIVFAAGYPISAGAYDGSFGGGQVDIGLTKFTADGSGVVYSTYIGGAGTETPHSIIVNDANELYMLGATSSSNFPLGSSPYDGSFGGGIPVTVSGISFPSGSDIFVFKLNAAGTTPLGSTYLGGTNNDGISTGDNVAFNYGDMLRGEIMLDDASNVYITSVSNSSNFPVVGGFDATLGGPQDAIVAKLNSGLSALLWSTYLGGTGLESGNSVQLASNGDIFVGGGTTSSNLPNTSGQVNPSFMGGITDGYVYRFSAPTYGSPIGTYVGTSDYDQTYFVQLDIDDYVYLYGQTRGTYPISGGPYNNPNSGQFLHKMSNDLSSTEWSSSFGASSGNEELSPTAFLVSDCFEIYIAGWGGNTNSSNSSAVNSSSSGMPITADAYQSTTTGNNFYLAVFTADMDDIKYSTYMGSTTSNDHVDGGTSRFDKQGGVYHAVCAACGGGAFPTTPGVYSETNGSANCNMAGFLFELSKIEATLGVASPVVCIPDPVIFDNDSENGNAYFWDFGDGSGTSTAFEPTYYYTEPGDYTVMLIVSDTSGCYEPDTAYIDVTIELAEAEAGALTDTICPGDAVELWAIGGSSYSWGPADVLDDPTSANPVAVIYEETTFTVNVESECGTSVVEVTVYVFDASGEAFGDTAICVGGSADLLATGGESYSWNPPESLDDPTSPNPVASPPLTTYYDVTITTSDGCIIKDTIRVWVDQDIPYPSLIDEITICKGDNIQVTAGGATDYLWSPDYNISDVTAYNPTIWPQVDTSYSVIFSNACGSSYDTLDVYVIDLQATVSNDTTICPGTAATLWASGGLYYSWSPSGNLSAPKDSITEARPWTFTTYTVIVTDEYGCTDEESVNVFTYDLPEIKVSPNVYAIQGDTVQIWAEGTGIISWDPPYNISCIKCDEPYVWPEYEQTYTATVTDENGCKVSAPVTVLFDPLIYVPNAFTPNGDSHNHFFKAIASNINEFEMLIFNRWGEIVWQADDLDDQWDGTINLTGVLAPDDVYVWQIQYQDLKGNKEELRGHVVLLK